MTRNGRTGTVVALRALGLGDLCCAVPALRGLRQAFPGQRLVLAAPRWQEPLARDAGVDEVVDTSALGPIADELAGADLAVNLHGRGPQSTALLARTSPRRLVAFDHEGVRAPLVTRTRWREDEHEIRRWCRLLDDASIPADPFDLRLPTPRAAASPASGSTVVHPGAGAPARRWPLERFAELVSALVARGHRVALTGTREERARCRAIAAIADEGDAVTVLAGRTGMLDLARVVHDAALVVSNDTGVAHLATAYGIPSVVLFGPTSPAEWGPLVPGRHRALWAGIRGDPHGDRTHPGLTRLTVAQVVDAAEEVLRDAVT